MSGMAAEVQQQQPLLGYLQQQAVHQALPLLAEQTNPYCARQGMRMGGEINGEVADWKILL